MPEDWENGGFGLYVHWPFCQAKCPYCDFNSHVAQTVDQDRWRRAYVSEIGRIGAETKGRVLRSIFFGGGTPSLMAPSTVAAIVQAAGAEWAFANDVEVTLEANPTSVEAGRFAAYHDAGVNRISLGIQALNDKDLRSLGRMHTADEAFEAFDVARNQFERISFDLIYARQNQTLADWQSELDQALAMAVDHLSLYQLTIEPGTVFGTRHALGKLRGLPDEDLAADMYEQTQEIAHKRGFAAYEVSNHAKSGQESRHNLIYWRSGDYVGIGPGAHGRLTLAGQRYATETPLAPGDWLDRVGRTGNGESSRQALTADEQRTEYLLMGLRLTEGVDIGRLGLANGLELERQINRLRDDGLIGRVGNMLAVTARGRPVLNAVLGTLLAD